MTREDSAYQTREGYGRLGGGAKSLEVAFNADCRTWVDNHRCTTYSDDGGGCAAGLKADDAIWPKMQSRIPEVKLFSASCARLAVEGWCTGLLKRDRLYISPSVYSAAKISE